MIRYRLTLPTACIVTVGLSTTAPDEEGIIEYAGDPAHIETVRWVVEGANGPRAQRLTARTTAEKLRHAMELDVLLQQYRPRLIQSAQ